MSKVDAEDEVSEQAAEVFDPSNPVVLEKYKRAATIAQSTLAHILSLLSTPQPSPPTILSLCQAGDAHIAAEVAKVYAKEKKMEKGVAFPTCVSLNHIVGHVSPLSGVDNGGGTVQPGDVVKIDIGVHFDGYASTLAHTTIAPAAASATPTPKVTGKPADVLSALSVCYDAVMRCMRPGAKSSQVTAIIAKVCADYGVSAVQGVLSHSLHRNRLDGSSVILNRAEDDVKVEELTFAVNDVFAIDVVLSSGEVRTHAHKHRHIQTRRTVAVVRASGLVVLMMQERIMTECNAPDFTNLYYVNHLNEPFPHYISHPLPDPCVHPLTHAYLLLVCLQGKPKPSEDDTTIYKRNLQSTYQLKMQVSRAVLSTIDKQHRHFPFTLRSLDESKAKFAIKECRQHDLVHAYPVLKEKEGEVVGQCKWTAVVSERGAVRLCGVGVEKERVQSEKKVQDDEVKRLLNQPLLMTAPIAAASGGAAAGAGGAGAAAGVSEADEAAAAKKKAAAAAKKKKQAAKKKASAAAGTAGGEAGKDGGKEDDEEDDGTE